MERDLPASASPGSSAQMIEQAEDASAGAFVAEPSSMEGGEAKTGGTVGMVSSTCVGVVTPLIICHRESIALRWLLRMGRKKYAKMKKTIVISSAASPRRKLFWRGSVRISIAHRGGKRKKSRNKTSVDRYHGLRWDWSR